MDVEEDNRTEKRKGKERRKRKGNPAQPPNLRKNEFKDNRMNVGVAVKGGVLKGKQKTSEGFGNEKQWENGDQNKGVASVNSNVHESYTVSQAPNVQPPLRNALNSVAKDRPLPLGSLSFEPLGCPLAFGVSISFSTSSPMANISDAQHSYTGLPPLRLHHKLDHFFFRVCSFVSLDQRDGSIEGLHNYMRIICGLGYTCRHFSHPCPNCPVSPRCFPFSHRSISLNSPHYSSRPICNVHHWLPSEIYSPASLASLEGEIVTLWDSPGTRRGRMLA